MQTIDLKFFAFLWLSIVNNNLKNSTHYLSLINIIKCAKIPQTFSVFQCHVAATGRRSKADREDERDAGMFEIIDTVLLAGLSLHGTT